MITASEMPKPHAIGVPGQRHLFGSDALYLRIAAATICSQVFEGPLRWLLNLASAGIIIYLRDLAAACVAGLIVAGWIAGDRKAFAFVVMLSLLLFHTLLGGFQLGSWFQAGFGFKIFLGFLLGFAIAPLLKPRIHRMVTFASLVFWVTAFGVILNSFVDFPWIGLEYETALGAAKGSKDWTVFGTPRLPGFSRSSISAASIMSLTVVPMMTAPQRLLGRVATLLALVATLVLTTTKGVWTGLAACCADAFLNSILGLTMLANLGLMLLAAVCFALPVVAVQVSLMGDGIPRVLRSFQERVEFMWPMAFDLVENPAQLLWGRGLGGIGVPLSVGSQWNHLNAADNFFVFVIVTFGALGVLYVGVFVYRLVQRLTVHTRRDPLALCVRAWAAILFGYGLTNNMVEDPTFIIVLGIMAGLVFSPSPFSAEGWHRADDRHAPA